MVQKAKDEQADIVCGSRYMKGGRQIGGGFVKSTLSRCAGYSLRYLAGVPTHDATNSFKLYKKSFLSQQTIESSGGFELGLELVIKAFLQGYKIAEVPTVWRDRKNGRSHFQLVRWLPFYLNGILKHLPNSRRKLLPFYNCCCKWQNLRCVNNVLQPDVRKRERLQSNRASFSWSSRRP